MVISLGQGMVIPTIPLLAVSFGVSVGVAAQVVTAHLLGRTVALIPSGIIVDQVGRKMAMIIGPLIIAASAVLTAYAPNFFVLLLAQFLKGGGGSMWQLGREVAAVDLVRADQRGRMMSAFFGLGQAGMALGPLLGGIIADQLNLQAVFLIYAAMALMVLPISFTIKEPQRPSGAPVARGSRFGLARIRDIDPFFRLTFMVLLFATISAMMRNTTFQTMLPLYAGLYHGLSVTKVGSLFALRGLIDIAMIVPVGFISDKLGRKAATVPSAFLGAVAFVGFYLSDSMLGFVISTTILGISTGLALGSMTTSTYDVSPQTGRAQFQALRRTVGEVGALAGPLLSLPIANTYHAGMPFLFFAPVHLLTAILLIFVARESLPSKRKAGPTPIPDDPPKDL